jgi:hypothetical protein
MDGILGESEDPFVSGRLAAEALYKRLAENIRAGRVSEILI